MWFSSNSRQIILLIVKTTYIYVISSSQKSVVVTFTVVSMPLVHSSLLLYILYILYVSKSVWQKKLIGAKIKTSFFIERPTTNCIFSYCILVQFIWSNNYYCCRGITLREIFKQCHFKNCQNCCVPYGFIVSWLFNAQCRTLYQAFLYTQNQQPAG